jgi:predicted CXXCH cytochrome family protein
MFVPASTSGTNKFATQPEQMHDSRCFRASEGRLGCISCHDPHVLPGPEEKPAYYRDRCLGCHTDQDCRLPANDRAKRTPANDCTGCHMPRSSSSNNTHVATTNHRIPRSAEAETERAGSVPPESRDYLNLVHFHRDLLSDQQRALTERDRGIALCRTPGVATARLALPLLEAAVAARPDDLSARESLAEVLGRLRRPNEGLAAYKVVLKRDPTRQIALEGAAHLAYEAGRLKESVELWRQAIAVNPWRTDYHNDMALAALESRDWRTAIEASREALRLNPSLLNARKWLVQCYLHLGDRAAARKEFEKLLAFDPPDREALLRRFTSLAAPP